MPLPPPLSDAATNRLPGAAVPVPVPEPAPVADPPVAVGMRGRTRANAGRVLRRVMRPALASLQAELTVTRVRVEALEQQVRTLGELQALLSQLGDISHRLNSMNVNQELLKGELRQVLATIDRLGTAIAPGAGLDGAGVRFAELRERVYGLERRLRTLVSAAASEPKTAVPEVGPAPNRAAAVDDVASDLFDYAGFEQRFRGDPALILQTLEARYLDVLAASPPVLDVGCGRGELVALLGARGVDAYGIDLDPSLVAEGHAAGLDIRLGDVVAHLEGLEPESLGAIISTHVVEHLELDALLRFIELAASRLRPGGVFIAETPNPASLIVLGNSYILDPTHVRPLHPSLLAFLCETAGFRDVALQFYAPAEGYWLSPVDAADAPEWVAQVNAAFEQLNRVLFGPQEYSVIARTPPAPAAAEIADR